MFINTNTKPFSRRHASLLMALFLLATLITSLISPAVTHATTVSSMTPDQEAASLSYYSALGGCVQNNMWGDISIQAGDNGNATPASWFNNNNAYATVYPDGKLDCKDIAPKALDLWGWGNNYQQFLRDIGYTYNVDVKAGTFKWDGPSPSGDGGVRVNHFYAAVQAQVYQKNFTGDPPISGQARYNMAVHYFTGDICKAQDLGTYPDLGGNNTYKQLVDANSIVDAKSQPTFGATITGSLKYRKVSIANADGTTADHGYAFLYSNTITTSDISSTDQTSVDMYGYHDGSNNSRTCDQLADDISNNAAAAANYAYANQTPLPDATGKKSANPSGQGSPSTCALNGVGWIVCPVSNFIASITDGMFSILQNFLVTAPLVSSSPVYNIWSSVRNLANVMFVIGFMVIIFSQLSGIGLTNYNIKKMLPRIIIAAILVNVSYWVCALAVDLSNLVGVSLRGLIDSALTSTGQYNLDTFSSITGWLLSGGLIATGVVVSSSLILGAGGWIAALALLLPVMISAFLAILTVVFVLAARQAIIILLVVLSPLAFVAFLLPNTESLFTKWRKLFVTMLVIFPMISLLFGATKAAAAIVRGTTTDPLIYIFSLAIQIIPLFLTPFLVKMGGGIFSRISGMVNNPNRGPIDRIRKRAEAFGKYKASDARAQNLAVTGKRSPLGFVGYSRRRAERDAIYSSAETRAQESGVEYMGRQLKPNKKGDPENQKLAQRMAGSNEEAAIQRIMSRGAASVEEIELKDLKAGHVLINNAQLDGDALRKLFEGEDVEGMNGMVKATKETQMAAADLMMTQGRQMDMVVQKLATSGNTDLQKFAVTLMQKNYSKAKEKQIGLTDEGLMRKIASGSLANDIDFQAAFNQASAEKMVGATVTVMSTQEKSSLSATQKGIGYITKPEDVVKIRETAAKVIITPSAVEKTNKDTYKAIQELSASINTQMPGQGTLF